jgi:putative restriction endonuclease
MTWQESVAKAIRRLTSRTGNKVFTRQELIDSEIGQIVAETGSSGETPEQTLSRVLQELRSQGMLEFESAGVYRLLS